LCTGLILVAAKTRTVTTGFEVFGFFGDDTTDLFRIHFHYFRDTIMDSPITMSSLDLHRISFAEFPSALELTFGP